MTPGPGDDIRIVLSKWGGELHREFGGTLLGSDAHGDWIGIPAGSLAAGQDLVLPSQDWVVLVPAKGHEVERAWLATFGADGDPFRTYVDITTAPAWDGRTVGAVDLDLDVVRADGRGVYVDDEDEFAEHQVLFGYPPEVVELALKSCALVHDAVLHQHAPFDGTADTWLARLTAAS